MIYYICSKYPSPSTCLSVDHHLHVRVLQYISMYIPSISFSSSLAGILLCINLIYQAPAVILNIMYSTFSPGDPTGTVHMLFTGIQGTHKDDGIHHRHTGVRHDKTHNTHTHTPPHTHTLWQKRQLYKDTQG